MVATSLSLEAITSAEELEGCEAESGAFEEMPAACNPCSTEVVIAVTRDGISKEPVWACVVPLRECLAEKVGQFHGLVPKKPAPR